MRRFEPEELKPLLAMDRLPPGERSVVLLAGALSHSAGTGATMIETLIAADHDPRRMSEVCLQAALFNGFPRCIGALAALTDASPIDPLPPARLASPRDTVRWRQKGEDLFRRIYGEHAATVLGDLDRFHPELRDWILVGAYGRILARPSLEPRVRELCATASLVVSGDIRPVPSHMRGVINCGGTPDEVTAVIDLVEVFMAPEDAARARETAARL